MTIAAVRPVPYAPPIRLWLLTIFFLACVWPYSISLGGQGVSANYTYILLPLAYALTRGAVRRPSRTVLRIMAVYTVIFAVAWAYQTAYVQYFDRRVASFVLFMSMFSYMFLHMDDEMVKAFKAALIAISIYFSARALAIFLLTDAAALGAHAKDVVGTSRFGFIYLLAFWVVHQEKYERRAWRMARSPILLLLALGILLTFSRASIVSFAVSIGGFAFANARPWLRRVRRGLSWKMLVSLLALVVGIVVVIKMVPSVLTYFDENIVVLFLDTQTVSENLATSESSEGFRWFIFKLILEFVWKNPLTGCGFLGVWVLFDDLSGSAHNQYTDVLFRTGVFGFMMYAYLLHRLLRFLKLHERPLYWGMLGVLTYGLFHETFKESQGAFVLAFLLGLMSQRRDQSSGGLAPAPFRPKIMFANSMKTTDAR